MRRKKWLIAGLIGMIIIGSIGYFAFPDLWRDNLNQIMPPDNGNSPADDSIELGDLGDFGQPIRPANEVVQIRATGNIALQEQETLVSSNNALINKVHVKVGDSVSAGDNLVEFDTKPLERQVEEARFNLAKAQAELKKLTEPSDPDKIAAAEQRVLIAREELKTLEAGPTAVELQVAEAEAFVAWAKYNKLVAGKTDDELAKARTALRKAERNLQRAQEAYGSISWRSNFELTETNARALEEATDAYENAKASYNEATKPVEEKDLRESHSTALQAQKKLEDLRQKPTKKEMLEAELKVQEAQDELKKLTNDPDKIAELKMDIEHKELLLADAENRLAHANLAAPFTGTVVAVDAQVGKTAGVNDKMVTIANLEVFKLTVNVPEAKINRLYVGQPVTISLDALPDNTFSGKVSYISSISSGSGSGEGGVVNYAVTVQLEINRAEGIRAGMTAVVTFIDKAMENAWLVPTESIQQGDDEATVTVYRDGEILTVKVEPDIKRGEWTVVHAPDLKAGDKVEAKFASFLSDDALFGQEYEFKEGIVIEEGTGF